VAIFISVGPARRPSPDELSVTLRPLIAAKLALYQAMRENLTTNVSLAAKLGIPENSVRRMLDLDHESKIGLIAAALSVFNKELVVSVRNRAA
jgi:antitoxin HicB